MPTERKTDLPVRELFAIGILAMILRIVLFAGSMFLYGYSAADIGDLRDGHSYLAYAQALSGDPSGFSEYDHRVFPGYPALIAMVARLGVPWIVSAVGLNWLCVGLAAVAFALLFEDRRLGWSLAVLTPTYLAYSTMVMSEPSMLALTGFGLLAARRDHPLAGGALIGLAGLTRPLACFAALGYLAFAASRGHRRRLAQFAVAALGVVVVGFAFSQWQGAGLAESIRVYQSHPSAYAGRPFGWPFESLLTTPFLREEPLWRIGYAWLHALVVTLGCGLLLAEFRNRPWSAVHPLTWLAVPWLLGNTLFILCLNHYWGFQEFHRFTVTGLPPLFWAYRSFLPEQRWVWVGVGLVSTAMAFFALSHQI